MEGGDGITLEDFAMILIAGDECIGGEVDSSDISKNNHTIGSSYPCHCVVLSHVDADIAAACSTNSGHKKGEFGDAEESNLHYHHDDCY
jgi:hypothetical protein